jgi:branched-chain amino acid transport system substrate-binding protein
MLRIRQFIGSMGAMATLVASAAAWGQAATGPIKLGILNDQSSVYAASGGKDFIVSAEMAVADFGGKVLGRNVVVINADHQSKPDVATEIARKWIDVEHVDAFLEVQNTSVVLAVLELAKASNKAMLMSAAGSSDLTNKYCSDVSAQWTWDNYALAKAVVAPLLAKGQKTWFLIIPDYTFGTAVERDTRRLLEAGGGKVVGSVRVRLGNKDFSSALLQAQNSGAQVIATANSGDDAQNFIKQAAEFGMTNGKQKIVSISAGVTDIEGVGLDAAQNVSVAESFYWDMNDATRAFTKRFTAKTGRIPNMFVAGTYSSTLHLLKGIQAAGSTDGRKVLAKMRELPINDFMTHNGKLREDGRVLREMYLFQVKTPAESKSKWDLYKLVATTPAEVAFQPLSESACPLIKK